LVKTAEHAGFKEASLLADQARTVDAIPANQQTAYAQEQEIGGAE
jgi:hypothetical protein